jgi:hypothetical protein
MKKIGWFFGLYNQQPTTAIIQCVAGGIGLATLLIAACGAAAQSPTPDTPISAPTGYVLHQSVDLG